MNESILNSIKKLIGLPEDYDHFDVDIMIHINSVLATLNQLGVGPEGGFSITGASETWADFLQDEKVLDSVKSYVYLKVRLTFDPPFSPAVIESFKEMTAEYEWRLMVAVEFEKSKEESEGDG